MIGNQIIMIKELEDNVRRDINIGMTFPHRAFCMTARPDAFDQLALDTRSPCKDNKMD